MKTLKAIIISTIIIIILSSCTISFYTIEGSGKITTETRKIKKFNKIDVGGGFEIILIEGDKSSIKITTDDNLMEYIDVSVKNEILIIETTERLSESESTILQITYTDLKSLDLSGAIELKTKNILHASNLQIDGSGAIELNMEIETNNLNLDLSGASKTNLKGKANIVKVDLSGASELKAFDCNINKLFVDISGAGSAYVNVNTFLDAEISGAGEITYTGHPEVKKSISGAGSIHQK